MATLSDGISLNFLAFGEVFVCGANSAALKLDFRHQRGTRNGHILGVLHDPWGYFVVDGEIRLPNSSRT